MPSDKCGSPECLLDELKDAMENQHRDTKEFIKGIMDVQMEFMKRELDQFRNDNYRLRTELDISVKHTEAALMDRIEDLYKKAGENAKAITEIQTAMKVGWEATLDGAKSLGDFIDKRIKNNQTVSFVEVCNTSIGKILITVIGGGALALFGYWLGN